jgi:hypothetical protein
MSKAADLQLVCKISGSYSDNYEDYYRLCCDCVNRYHVSKKRLTLLQLPIQQTTQS